MGRATLQLEFRWASWLRRFKSRPVRKAKIDHSDSGLSVWCADAALGLGLPELARKVRVTWNPRMQTTAGRAWWPDRLIELNPKLRDLAPDELWRTLKHELAHLVAYERCGRRQISAHGPEWEMACAELGIAGERAFHTLPLKSRPVARQHAYVCPNCLTVIERVRPIRRVVACYDCCRKYNRGAYHDDFRLIKKAPEA